MFSADFQSASMWCRTAYPKTTPLNLLLSAKQYKIVSGGTVNVENGEEFLTNGSVEVDDSMTAKVPVLVKAAGGASENIINYIQCSMHTTSNWNSYHYDVGHKFSVEPLLDLEADVRFALEEGVLGASDYPANFTLGKDSFNFTLKDPVRTGYRFTGLSASNWSVVKTATDSGIIFKPTWQRSLV